MGQPLPLPPEVRHLFTDQLLPQLSDDGDGETGCGVARGEQSSSVLGTYSDVTLGTFLPILPTLLFKFAGTGRFARGRPSSVLTSVILRLPCAFDENAGSSFALPFALGRALSGARAVDGPTAGCCDMSACHHASSAGTDIPAKSITTTS